MFFICCDTFSLTPTVFRAKKRNKPFLSDINDSSGVSQKIRSPMVAETAEARFCKAYVMFFAKKKQQPSFDPNGFLGVFPSVKLQRGYVD